MRRAHWGGPGEDYRLKKLSATAIGEASSIGSPAPDEAAPVWQPPKAQHSFPWLEIVLTAAGIIGLIGLTVFFLSPGGIELPGTRENYSACPHSPGDRSRVPAPPGPVGPRAMENQGRSVFVGRGHRNPVLWHREYCAGQELRLFTRQL